MQDLRQLSDQELLKLMKHQRALLRLFAGSLIFTAIMLAIFGFTRFFIVFLFVPFSPAIFRYRKYLKEVKRRNLKL